MPSNAYLLAKIGADTTENKQHFAEILPIGILADDRDRDPRRATARRPAGRPGRRGGRVRVRGLESAKLANFAKFCKFLAGSFSAVSKRNFARKYAFDSIFQALQDLHTFAPLQSQNFSKKSVWKSALFVKIQQKICKCCKICKILPNFKIFSWIIW